MKIGIEGAASQASQLENACNEALEPFGPRAMPLRDLARFAVQRGVEIETASGWGEGG